MLFLRNSLRTQHLPRSTHSKHEQKNQQKHKPLSLRVPASAAPAVSRPDVICEDLALCSDKKCCRNFVVGVATHKCTSARGVPHFRQKMESSMKMLPHLHLPVPLDMPIRKAFGCN